MKRNFLAAICVVLSLFVSEKASAQYTSIVNQVANIVQTAAYGGAGYKGYIDASYTGGFGNVRADFLGVSTTQGATLSSWFFMGAGLGVDVVFSKTGSGYVSDWNGSRKTRTCGVMIPVFTDFRFNFGQKTSTGIYLDVKAGGSFLIGGDYLAIENGYISSTEYFLLKPTLGIRVPMGGNGKKAVNIGLTYQLLTCNYWWNNNSSSGTLNSLGATVAYEW